MKNDRKTRLIIGGILSVLLLIGLHVVGLFIAVMGWFFYGCFRLAMYFYTHGTHYIARVHAEEAAKLADERANRAGQNGAATSGSSAQHEGGDVIRPG